ncbi:MAG: response regulator transcription factor [Chloroflexota bacterium]
MSTPRVTVLVADDERPMARLIKSELGLAGYRVLVAEDGIAAIDLAMSANPDLIILDIMMPGRDGFAVCKDIREFSFAPIIVLSARGQEQDKVRALDLGADDYMTKPFGVEELLARVKAAVRRARHAVEGPERAPLTSGSVLIDFAAHRVTRGGMPVKLTTTEYKLLAALAKQPGRVLLHEALLRAAWGPEYSDQVEYLWVYVGRLRGKLEDDPNHPLMIRTAPGIGYRFEILPPGEGNCG